MKNLSTTVYFASDEFLQDERCFLYFYDKVSNCRKRKIDRLKMLEDKRLSLLSGLLLEYALNDVGENSKEVFEDESGKPYLKDGAAHFNISHSGSVATCVVSRYQVGCDVEKVREIDLKIAKRYFCKEEADELFSLKKESDRIDAFFRLWTLKESYVKAVGKGLAIPLNSFSISLGNPPKIAGEKEEFFFSEITCFDGYKCAVCASHNEKVQQKVITLEQLKSVF